MCAFLKPMPICPLYAPSQCQSLRWFRRVGTERAWQMVPISRGWDTLCCQKVSFFTPGFPFHFHYSLSLNSRFLYPFFHLKFSLQFLRLRNQFPSALHRGTWFWSLAVPPLRKGWTWNNRNKLNHKTVYNWILKNLTQTILFMCVKLVESSA